MALLRARFASRFTCIARPFSTQQSFKLTSHFVNQHREIVPPFGFNGLGELVYRRTYSRIKADGKNEEWAETIERVVNATYNMQKRWIEEHNLGWNAKQAQLSAQEMYRRIFHMKFLPPGRGLWAMGSPLTEERGLFAALNNCAFVSTENLKEDPSKPFCFLMDAAMLGVGVGFDVRGAGNFVIRGPNTKKTSEVYIVDDSREGWVEAVRRLLNSYFLHERPVEFDYSKLRPAGTPIKGFGGVAAGATVLKTLIEQLQTHALQPAIGQSLSITCIVDIFNLIGTAVVAGNVRQTAEIAFGPTTVSNQPEDTASPLIVDPNEYIDLKNYTRNPQRAAFGWASNNSVFAELGMDYAPIAKRIMQNGEPGLAWLHNMQNFGRMNGTMDLRDRRAKGGNPCLEQTLESYEMCCLVETFPHNHDSIDDYLKTLRYAYLYAKTVTLGRTHWPETNRVMLRNRRIGCSMSGLAQFVAKRGLHELQKWSDRGYAKIQEYDEEYSEWFAIPRSIKSTSIKPSGTVSLLAGATPGMHFPSSRFYLRRVRFANTSALLEPIRRAGYPIEPSVTQPDTTCVVEFPIDAGAGIRTERDVGMWEQLSFASFLQKHWADNQVSCTVTFDPASEGPQLEAALSYFQYQLKGVSFLPRIAEGAYPQMPIQAIDEEDYQRRIAQLKPLNFSLPAHAEQPIIDRFCDSDTCQLTSQTSLPTCEVQTATGTSAIIENRDPTDKPAL